MIIERIDMENFGPYYGHQHLELGTSQHPLVIVHGQNMTGKTSVLNAVRWALYGVAKDRFGGPLPTRELINYDAFDEGQRRVSVRLTIRTSGEEGSAQYVLRRQRQAKRGVVDAESDTDFEEFVDIERDGDVLTPNAFPELVGTLLPDGISRFFLFDGELLNEYEELVREGGEREARGVKEAIEMILGLPAAKRGRDDVRALKDEVSRRLQREARKDRTAKAAGEELERLLARKGQVEQDRDALKAQLREVQQRLRVLDEGLKQYEESREDAGLKESLEQQLSDLAKRRARAMEDRRVLVKELWRDILAPRLNGETRRLEEERGRREDALHRLRAAEVEQGRLEGSIREGRCSHCGQTLPDEIRARTRAEIQELHKEIEDLKPLADSDRVQELAGTLRQLRAVAPAGKVDAVRLTERNLDEINLSEYRLRQDLDRVKDRLSRIDTEDLLRYDREAKQLEALRGEIGGKLRDAEKDADAITTEIDRQQRIVLQNDSPVFHRLKVELAILEGLEAIFARAVDELTNELRVEVERNATEIFKELTTDQTYAGLQINENYGLSILRHDRVPVGQRSAGAEQVVALSLLGALNRMATKRGPVIMDTPFGRLDRSHRANIMRFVPTMADQVVLLVHDGEIDRVRDLKDIVAQVDAEYRIEHPSSTRSDIVPEAALTHA